VPWNVAVNEKCHITATHAPRQAWSSQPSHSRPPPRCPLTAQPPVPRGGAPHLRSGLQTPIPRGGAPHLRSGLQTPIPRGGAPHLRSGLQTPIPRGGAPHLRSGLQTTHTEGGCPQLHSGLQTTIQPHSLLRVMPPGWINRPQPSNT
jgi:hypothetical protein